MTMQRLRSIQKLLGLTENALVSLGRHSSPRDIAKALNTGAIGSVIIQMLWGIGDAVLMSPLLMAIKKQYPKVSINLIGKSFLPDLFRPLGIVDSFIQFDAPWTAFAGKYRVWSRHYREAGRILLKECRGKFDLSITDRADFRDDVVSWAVGARFRVGYGRTAGWPFLTHRIRLGDPFLRPIHRVLAVQEVADHLGLHREGMWPVVRRDDGTTSLPSRPRSSDAGYVVVHPGARIETRRWPLSNFRRVVEYLLENTEHDVLVVVDPNGYGRNMIVSPDYDRLHYVQPSLAELIAILGDALAVICNDSGPMHIAAAVGTPVVAIFGPTSKVRFGPYGADHDVVIEEPMTCRPCYDKCIYRSPKCMDAITPERVIDRISGNPSFRTKRSED